MDDLDQRLISELRINARASIPTLASILGVARGTIQSRMERLIASGVIAGRRRRSRFLRRAGRTLEQSPRARRTGIRRLSLPRPEGSRY